MFDIGFFELVLLAVLGLLVLGPQRLPQAVRTLGLYVGRIRKAVSGIQNEVNEQLRLEEMHQRMAEHERKVKAGLHDAEQELQEDFKPTTPPTAPSTTSLSKDGEKPKSPDQESKSS
ncbi:Sec-independent protein translocase protein TatB [Marinospirillum perlucidum]|uniref:Sec-independent protein translocase protein TatB n=1 Tax=Marinospirillum perlucidum TaxID=1982602 RepID=UPI000DF13FF2|nr:Sec-independent protein translocase protein TatB [Marinospirillum perlucidum]